MPVEMKLSQEHVVGLCAEDLERKGFKICTNKKASIEIDEELGKGTISISVCGNGFSCECAEIAALRAEKEKQRLHRGEIEYIPDGESQSVRDIEDDDDIDGLAGFE